MSDSVWLYVGKIIVGVELHPREVSKYGGTYPATRSTNVVAYVPAARKVAVPG
jgi:hypothetical protein